MKKFCKFRVIAITLAILTVVGLTGCPQQKVKDKKPVTPINVKSIKVGNVEYNDQQIKVTESTAIITVEVDGNYENLSIKINKKDCPVNKNIATSTVQLKKKDNKIKIEITAKDRIPVSKEISIYYSSRSVITEITVDNSPKSLSELNASAIITTRELKPVVVLTTSSKFESIKTDQFTQEIDSYKKIATLTLKENIQVEKELPVSIEVTTTDDEPIIINFKLKRPKPRLIITNVTLNNDNVTQNSTVNLENEKANLTIGFEEAYKGLAVTVNDKPADVAGPAATYSFTLNNGENPVAIKANADEADEISFNFTINYKPPVLDDIILSTITINDKTYTPDAVNIVNKDSAKIEVKLQKEYDDILVKVNNNPANQTYTHKRIFDYTIQGLTSAETPVTVEITATGKNKKEINFSLKYEAVQEKFVTKVEAFDYYTGDYVNIKYQPEEKKFNGVIYDLMFSKLKITIDPKTKAFSKFKMKIKKEDGTIYAENEVFKMVYGECICEINKTGNLKDGTYVNYTLELFYDNSTEPIETQTISLKGTDMSGGGDWD